MAAVPRRLRLAVIGTVFLTSAGLAAAATPAVVQTRRALDHLGEVAIAWQNQFQCSGCHKQPLTIAALGTAVSQGHDAPLAGVVDALVTGTLTGSSGQHTSGCFSFGGSSKITMATTFAGRGLEAFDRYLGPSLTTNLVAAADCLLARQAADGRLPADSTELPVAQGDFVTTAHGAYVWRRAYERSGATAYQAAEAQAVAWLRGRIASIEAAPASFTTQDTAMLLAGLGRSGASPSDADVQRVRAVLASAQLGDGSFKIQSSTAGGNAHATGQVVFAMRAAGYDRSDPVLEAGRSWLLSNQQADGSWPASHWVGGTPSEVAPSMWGALALATFPSPLVTLRGSGDTVEWANVEGAESYDLIRGSVASLALAGGNVDLGVVACVAPALGPTSVVDPATPAPGEAFFYVFRIRWAGNHDGYGRSSDGRDRLPLAGDCSP